MTGAMLLDWVARHGPAMFLLAAIIEGPVVTILAAALAQRGVFDLAWVLPLAVLGDVLGDVLVHLAGRFAPRLLPQRLRHRLGLDRHLITPLALRFRRRGGRMLAVAKLTHFAGLPVLFASGVARMAFLPFLLVSLAATLPKVAVLAALGWVFGLALAEAQTPVWTIILGAGLAGLALYPLFRKGGTPWV